MIEPYNGFLAETKHLLISCFITCWLTYSFYCQRNRGVWDVMVPYHTKTKRSQKKLSPYPTFYLYVHSYMNLCTTPTSTIPQQVLRQYLHQAMIYGEADIRSSLPSTSLTIFQAVNRWRNKTKNVLISLILFCQIDVPYLIVALIIDDLSCSGTCTS